MWNRTSAKLLFSHPVWKMKTAPKLVLIATTSLFSLNAHAVLVKETWESTITGTFNTSAFSSGNQFNWTATYDNQSTRVNEYHNGADGNDDNGQGDDSLFFTYCSGLDPDAGNAAICTGGSFSSGLLANVVFTGIDPVANALLDGDSPFDAYSTSYRGVEAQSAGNAYSLTTDYASFFVSMTTTGSITVFAQDNGSYETRQLAFNNRMLSSVEIPSPVPLALMGLGLLGLRFTQSRKAQ